jgi:4-coumarate--CoA ligase
VIESLDGVEMVAVVGIPDPKTSNLPAAVIVRRQGFEQIEEHDVLAFVAEKFPHSKHLYGGVYFVDEMPITPNGKILRRLVREIAAIKHKNRKNT